MCDFGVGEGKLCLINFFKKRENFEKEGFSFYFLGDIKELYYRD